MSALATELGVGRATLYRWAGNREDLLGAVLAEATEHTFRSAVHEVDGRAADDGARRVLAVVECFMRRVLAADPLRALTQRDPRLFVRLATTPGLIETRSAQLVGQLIDAEVATGRMPQPSLPVEVLAHALVRIADGPLYAHLLGGGEPRLHEALAVVAVLLDLDPDLELGPGPDLGPSPAPPTAPTSTAG
jgi:AcrR family transcriptional regulator